jgi:hypothetical protein
MLNEPMGSGNQWMSDKITSRYLNDRISEESYNCEAEAASRVCGLWGLKSLFCLQATQIVLCMLIELTYYYNLKHKYKI